MNPGPNSSNSKDSSSSGLSSPQIIFTNRPKPLQALNGDAYNVPELSEDFLYIRREAIVNSVMSLKEPSSDDRTTLSNEMGMLKKSSSEIRLSFSSIENKRNQNQPELSASNMVSMNNQVLVNTFENGFLGGIDNLPLKRRSTKEFLPLVYSKGSLSECEKTVSNPFIYSYSKFHPFSFFCGSKRHGWESKGKLLYPSPLFIESEKWMTKPDLSKDAILHGMVVNDTTGLVLVDPLIMKKFHGLIGDFIKQLISFALGNKISLKVKLFEPKSTLQRIADYWSFAPQYLSQASDKNISPIERMLYVMAFCISGLYIPTKQLKPFNAQIGETFQGELPDGGKVYLEQISHYPTIARLLIIHESYRVHGYFDFHTKGEGLTFSKLNVIQKGAITVEFPKLQEKVTYMMPIIKMLNIKQEEGRSSYWDGNIVFTDTLNNLKGVIKFAYDKKCIHKFLGGILPFSYPSNFHFSFDEESTFAKNLKFEQTQFLVKVNGSWVKEMSSESKTYWNIDTDIPSWVRPQKNVIPSDGRFREDLIWLYRSFYSSTNEKERIEYENLAQSWKVTAETMQRNERDIRAKNRRSSKK